MTQSLPVYKRLRHLIFDLFNEEELRSLCFDLDVNYDGLPGRDTEAKARELVMYMRRRQRLGELLEVCRQLRPSADWPEEISESRLAPITPTWWRGEPQQFVLLAGSIILLLIILIVVISWPKDSEQAAPTQEVVMPVGIETATTTIVATKATTPTPTNTPTPTPPPDVIIVEFEPPPNRFVKVAPLIEENLLDTLDEYDLSGVNVQVVDQPITSRDEADTLATTSGSKAIIWGWYDDLGINVRIYLTSEIQQSRNLLRTSAVPLVSTEADDSELALRVVNDVLPDNVTFLSLFVIGQLEYQANEYQKGFTAFDAAMANMPETVMFENPALLHFFRGRQLEAIESDDKETIACEYAGAITADPEFAPAYNNLGILLARFGHSKPPEIIQDCLVAAFPEWENTWIELPGGVDLAYSLLNEHSQLQPESAVSRYNYLALMWSNEFSVPERQIIEENLEEIIARDPSLPGPYIMRAMLAYDLRFGQPDFDAAVADLETAINLLPDVPELRVNLGQIYSLNGRLAEAEAAFQAALELDAHNWEALLAMANLIYRQEGGEAAEAYLAQIPRLEQAYPLSAAGEMYNESEFIDSYFRPISPVYMADLFRSRLLFDAGDTRGATQTLNQILTAKEQIGLAFGFTTLTPPWERYLVVLLNSLKDSVPVSHILTGTFLVFADEEISGLATTFHTWEALENQCATGLLEPADWGTEANDCLPEDMTERITAVYDLFQEQLGRRMSYQLETSFAGMACPYVFTYDETIKTWALDTSIIYDLVGPDSEATQQRQLHRFDGRLLIREVEPEISHLDMVYVLAIGENGREYILEHELPSLQTADDNYLVLRQGDSQWLNFPGYAKLDNIQQYWVVARGYYEPLAPYNSFKVR